jgi:N-sulfoglucosamine sulfohydrolase
MNPHLSRRTFLSASAAALGLAATGVQAGAAARRPNILLAISDDQSFPHASAYGYRAVSTPAFDRIAREGALFMNGFCAAPQCSPCRAAMLTGRNIWQIEEAGTHASNFPAKFAVYPELLEQAGYHVGFTGKGWGPGNFKISGRTRNPAGEGYNRRKLAPPARAMSGNDYAGNLEDFLAARPKDAPFCFWFGASEPHRDYDKGVGLRAGRRLEDVVVPPFLPDTPEIRSDILDYCFEIEWFDQHLGRMIGMLEAAGELDNTLIIVTADNGMPFPYAKANLQEYGIHMPLAMRWGARMPGGRRIEDLVGFIDFAPTLLEAAGLPVPAAMTGRSLMNIIGSDRSGIVDPSRRHVLAGRERHTHARPDNVGYPARAIRTHDFLYIRNLKPDRWPAGDGPGYHDIDPSPAKSFLLENRHVESVRPFAELAVARRPLEELFDIRRDPGCLRNLAGEPEYAQVKQALWSVLEQELTRQGDPRMSGSEIFDSYPRYSPMRKLGGFDAEGQYNPAFGAGAGKELPAR